MDRRQRNAICDVCGFKFKDWQLKQRWDGNMVCPEDFETRHTLDFARVPRTEKAPEWTRPRVPDVSVSVTYNTTSGVQSNTIPSGTFNPNTL